MHDITKSRVCIFGLHGTLNVVFNFKMADCVTVKAVTMSKSPVCGITIVITAVTHVAV